VNEIEMTLAVTVYFEYIPYKAGTRNEPEQEEEINIYAFDFDGGFEEIRRKIRESRKKIFEERAIELCSDC
jgi:hypothetical protein